MITFTENLNILITIAGASVCLLPLLFLGTNSSEILGNLTFEGERVNQHPILLAILFLVIVPITDLLLDIPATVTSYFYPVETCSKGIIDGRNIFRLTDIEKLLFLTAMVIQSSIWFIPASTDLSTLGVISICTSNSCTILLLGPLLVFFQRSTTAFTGLRVFVILVSGILGHLLSSMCRILVFHLYGHEIFKNTGQALLYLSGAGYVILIVMCVLNYAHQRLGTSAARIICFKWLRNPTFKWRVTDDAIPFISNDNSELYTTYIPALHMISSMLLTVGRTYEALEKNDTSHGMTRISVSLVGQILVLVVELRIRKNEITRGLTALLHAKKVHVRYISHELRTPLNSTVLGVQVLLDDFKNRTDLAGLETFEILCDVHASCISTSNILDSLLCYEKLNFGMLELNRKNEVVRPYLDRCVAVFASQARGSGVTLTFDDGMHRDDSSINSGQVDEELITTRVLQQHDMISIDKRKMNQILRYLISNAIRFTPRGGSVTVRAMFVEDVQEVVLKENAIWSTNTSNLCYLKLWGGIVGKRAVLKLINSLMGNSWNCSSRVASYPISPQTDHNWPHYNLLNGKLVLEITDTGIGMSEENQKKYSGPRSDFNLERLHTIGDSGISLCITKGIVDLHGGNLKVYSAGKDMGCTFTIELPMSRLPVPPNSLGTTPPLDDSRVVLEGHRLPSDDFEPNQAMIQREQYAKSMDSYRDSYRSVDEDTIPDTCRGHLVDNDKHLLDVLIVDDSYLNRKLLLKLLRKDGHNCEEAEDGLEAVAQVAYRMKCDIETGGQDSGFDVILMDNVMPNMDGPTATKQIRDMGYKGIIFGVTGNGLPSDVSHFLKSGANKVILKPLRMPTFEAAMQEMRSLDGGMCQAI